MGLRFARREYYFYRKVKACAVRLKSIENYTFYITLWSHKSDAGRAMIIHVTQEKAAPFLRRAAVYVIS